MAIMPETSFDELVTFLGSNTETGHEFDSWDTLIDLLSNIHEPNPVLNLPTKSLTRNEVFDLIGYMIGNFALGTLTERMILMSNTREVPEERSIYYSIKQQIIKYTSENGNDSLTLSEIFRHFNNPTHLISNLFNL